VSQRLLQHSGRGSLEALLAASTTHTGHWHELVSELGKAQQLTEQQRKKRKSRGASGSGSGSGSGSSWQAAPQPGAWPFSGAAAWPAAGAQAALPVQRAGPAQRALQPEEERELAGALAAAGLSSDDESADAGPSSEEGEGEGSEAPEQLEAVGQGLARLEERALDEAQVGAGLLGPGGPGEPWGALGGWWRCSGRAWPSRSRGWMQLQPAAAGP
jgi:hypothetical protein